MNLAVLLALMNQFGKRETELRGALGGLCLEAVELPVCEGPGGFFYEERGASQSPPKVVIQEPFETILSSIVHILVLPGVQSGLEPV